ncbi:uncharacterized protein LOC142644018 [Castanea sativa]|uniref:uncharacterized protein LOC142644018 n=1 Tax=Castanea sativa TaxID=21020 RepID=UPI003F654977
MPRDKLVWAATPNGKFMVKSAYWLALDMKRAKNGSTSGPSGQQQLWRSIWSADVPNKIKNFAWRACQNILPTKANLFHSKVISSEKCRNGSSPAAFELAHFMAILWNLWNNRNGIRHGDVPKSVTNIVLEASWLIVEFQVVQDRPTLPAIPLHTRWKPPMPGVYKANVDGDVFKEQLTAGLGVIIRDADGQVVGALSQQIYAPLDALEAEAKAMEVVVLFARDVGIQEIIFEGDSLQVYNFLKGGS